MFKFMVMSAYVLFIILVLYPADSPLFAQTAQEFFQEGLVKKELGMIDEAIEAFKEAVEKDRLHTEALYEMGLIYFQKFTPDDLKKAESALDDAIDRCDILNIPDDSEKVIKYRTAFGNVLEEMKKITKAKDQWEKILKHQPDNYDALTGMAKYHAERVNQFRIRIRDGGIRDDINLIMYNARAYGDIVDDPSLYIKELRNRRLMDDLPSIRWDQFVEMDLNDAIKFNNRILEIYPDDRDTIYRLGVLQFDRVKFKYWDETSVLTNTFAQDPDGVIEFAKIFEELISKHPDDKDGHLFVGLAYHRLKDYDKAYDEFMTAHTLMDADESLVFTYVGVLENGGFFNNKLEPDQDANNFWRKRDPLYLTYYNERELEHYARVAEANLRFSIPLSEIEGWKTVQGKILIKYGQPQYMKKNVSNDIVSRAGFDFGGTPGFVSQDETLDYMKNEIWSYDDFSFIFETGWGDKYENYKFPPIMKETMKNVIEPVFPEYYKYEPKGLFIDFPYDLVTFRGENGKTMLEVFYGIPANRVKLEEEENQYTGVCRTGVFLHDTEWNLTVQDIQEQMLELETSAVDTVTDAIITSGFSYQVNPGNYFCSFELQDVYSDNAGFNKDTVFVEYYGFENLQISDILVSTNIAEIDVGAPVSRENIELTLNPRRFFFTGEPIFIYYEVYNLFIEGSPGKNSLTVEYSIQFAGEKQYSFGEKLKSLFNRTPKYKEVTTNFTISGSRQEEKLFLRIDHDLIRPGPYSLTLKITDNNSGNVTEKSTIFTLF
ncbi:GWxTD domain-containing protein [candidate division KSB1 bacterium]